MEITKEQQSIINEAVELLSPYAEKYVSYNIHLFHKTDADGNQEEIGDELCDKDECVAEYLPTLQAEYGETEIETIYSGDGILDRSRICRCPICNIPLNSSMDYIEQELDEHADFNVTKEHLTDENTAYDVKCMLESFPNVDDYDIRRYNGCTDEDLQSQVDMQKEFIEKVVSYAQLVIDVLK
jgi:hypothetical protein